MKRLFDMEDLNPQEYKDIKVGDQIALYSRNNRVGTVTKIIRRFYDNDNQYIESLPNDHPNKLFLGDEYSPLFEYYMAYTYKGKLANELYTVDSIFCKKHGTA